MSSISQRPADEDTPSLSIRKRLVMAVAVLVAIVTPVAVAVPNASAATATTAGLSAPSCYRHGFMLLSQNCTARDLWNQRVKPALDSGDRGRVTAAIATVLGPAANSTSQVGLITSIARPRCAAEGINRYLKLTVSRQKTLSAGATAFDAAVRAARAGGGTVAVLNRIIVSYRTAYDQMAAAAAGLANQAAARNILTGIGFCSA